MGRMPRRFRCARRSSVHDQSGALRPAAATLPSSTGYRTASRPNSASSPMSLRLTEWPDRSIWSTVRSSRWTREHSIPPQSSSAMSDSGRYFFRDQFRVGGEGLSHHLIHVVVAVGPEPANEVHVFQLVRQLLVPLVKLAVLRPRDGIVRVALGGRVLVHGRGGVMALARELLELRDPGVLVVVRVVDGAHGLGFLYLQGLEPELERAVGEPPEGVIEVRVDRPGVYEPAVLDLVSDLLEVGAEHDLDVRVRHHALEHPGVAVLRHGLELVGEVAVVAVGACGYPSRHRGVELAGIQAPLLPRVSPEELLVELLADLGDYDVFAGLQTVTLLRQGGEESLRLHGVEVHAVQLVEGV